jgi:phosphopantetheinyl transferase (holo-ACP synthase)
MILKKLIIYAGIAVFITAVSAHATPADRTDSAADSALKTRKEGAKKNSNGNGRKDNAKNKYWQLKEGLAVDAADIERLKEIIAKQEAFIASTNNKFMEMEKLRQNLVPYLATVVARLEEAQRKDLPFQQEERAKNIATLKELVGDPKVSMGEKLSKVMEGLRTEMDYGNTSEIAMEEIPYKGQKLQVNVLRLGRMALYMRTIDDKEAGIYNGKEWVPVSKEYNAEIKKAMENIKRSKSAEFVNLPLRGAGQ